MHNTKKRIFKFIKNIFKFTSLSILATVILLLLFYFIFVKPKADQNGKEKIDPDGFSEEDVISLFQNNIELFNNVKSWALSDEIMKYAGENFSGFYTILSDPDRIMYDHITVTPHNILEEDKEIVCFSILKCRSIEVTSGGNDVNTPLEVVFVFSGQYENTRNYLIFNETTNYTYHGLANAEKYLGDGWHYEWVGFV